MRNLMKTTGVALALLAGLAQAETFKATGDRVILPVNDAFYRIFTSVAVPNVVPDDEIQIVCDGQIILTTPGESVLISSRALAIQTDGIDAATVLPVASARVSYATRYWPVNRTGFWVSTGFYQDLIFTCEYQAKGALKLADLKARTVMWVQRRAP